jgi:hypothetical protein
MGKIYASETKERNLVAVATSCYALCFSISGAHKINKKSWYCYTLVTMEFEIRTCLKILSK